MSLCDVVACVRECTGHGLFLAVDEVQDLFTSDTPHHAGLRVEVAMLGDIASGGNVATGHRDLWQHRRHPQPLLCQPPSV